MRQISCAIAVALAAAVLIVMAGGLIGVLMLGWQVICAALHLPWWVPAAGVLVLSAATAASTLE